MRFQAIKNIHPTLVRLDADIMAYDANGDIIRLDEDKITKEVAKLQAEYDAKSYARARQEKFPTEHDLLVALWEKVMEDRSDSADALQAIRTQVKSDNPKP